MVRYRKLTVPFKILTYSIIVTTLLEVLAETLAIKYGNNIPAFHLEIAIQYVFYSLAYFYIFKSPLTKKIVLISIALVITFSVINSLFLQPLGTKFPTNIYLLTNIFLVIFSLLLFKQMLQYPLNVNIVKQSIFWFNTTIIFCSTTTFLNVGLLNYYMSHHWGKDILYYLWFVDAYSFAILICISLLTDNKENSIRHA
jgi:hypothetical protein